MPLSEEQREEMKRRRERIMAAATSNFSYQGYDNVPLSKIAKDAGISYGNIFTYFESKEHLFSAIVLEPLIDLKSEILLFSDNPSDPLKEIHEMVKNHIHIYSRYEVYLRLIQQVIGQHTRFTDLFAQLDDFHQEFKTKLENLIQKGQALGQLAPLFPVTTAVTYTSFLLGLRLNITDPPGHEVWDLFIPNAVQIFGPIKL